MTNEHDAFPKLLYTPVEAARSLGISRSTLYLLLSSGQIDSVKVGTLRRISTASLRDFVDRLALPEPQGAAGRGAALEKQSSSTLAIMEAASVDAPLTEARSDSAASRPTVADDKGTA